MKVAMRAELILCLNQYFILSYFPFEVIVDLLFKYL